LETETFGMGSIEDYGKEKQLPVVHGRNHRKKGR
jgi:hypothetical protein